MRRLLPLIAAIALATAGCGLLGGSTTTTGVDAAPTTSTTIGPTTTTSALSPEARATLEQVEALIPVTEDLRGLEFLEPPTIVVVTPDELEARVRDLIAEELEPDEVARDEALLRLLGVLDAATALDELYLDLYGEQVGGYYDLETRELVVPASDTELLVKDRVVIVHELVHALTDQHFGHGERLLELVDEERFDEHAALSSVSEGDAVRVESEYIRTLSPEDLQALVAQYDDLESTVFESAPFFLQESLVAPYLDGFEFLNALDADDAVTDGIYEDPPTTTEQVLVPEAYLRREPALPVGIDVAVPEGYEIGESSTWGASGLRSLLGAEVEPGPLAAAVDGWGGDAYRVLFDGTDAVFHLQYRGDDVDDLRELGEAFRSYLAARVAEDDAWTVRTDGTEIAVVVADDPEVLAAIVEGLAGFEGLDILPEPSNA